MIAETFMLIVLRSRVRLQAAQVATDRRRAQPVVGAVLWPVQRRGSGLPQLFGYAALKTRIGSTAAALRAGSRHAAVPTASNTQVEADATHGS